MFTIHGEDCIKYHRLNVGPIRERLLTPADGSRKVLIAAPVLLITTLLHPRRDHPSASMLSTFSTSSMITLTWTPMPRATFRIVPQCG